MQSLMNHKEVNNMTEQDFVHSLDDEQKKILAHACIIQGVTPSTAIKAVVGFVNAFEILLADITDVYVNEINMIGSGEWISDKAKHKEKKRC